MPDREPKRRKDTRIPRSERVIVRDRPHWLFIITGAWKWIIVGGLLWALLAVGAGRTGWVILGTLGWIVLAIVVLRLLIGAIDWIVREHILTDARIIAQYGILRTVRTDLPLRRVQHLVLVRPLAERVFGLGSIGVASAGTGSIEVVWRAVDHPTRTLELIREHTRRVLEGDEHEPSVTPVIGLVGGIGSGKSTVARAFAELGCLVSDSDEAVRELLTKPDVIERLVSWWGEKILDAQGQINRSAVADVVFKDPEERIRLEGLIHPMLRQSRQDLIRRAIDQDAPGVIIDAPLLFEAGVDAECDTVVFVDTPKRIRQQRVRETRNWDEQELDRRESAQMPVDEKQRRSDWTVNNAGDKSDLRARVQRILDEIRSKASRQSTEDGFLDLG